MGREAVGFRLRSFHFRVIQLRVIQLGVIRIRVIHLGIIHVRCLFNSGRIISVKRVLLGASHRTEIASTECDNRDKQDGKKRVEIIGEGI